MFVMNKATPGNTMKNSQKNAVEEFKKKTPKKLGKTGPKKPREWNTQNRAPPSAMEDMKVTRQESC